MRRFIDNKSVHLWWGRLDIPEKELGSLAALLSQEEESRAARFLSELHRRRYTAARGILRRILGSYLGVAAAEVPITNDKRGKPSLEAAAGLKPICFNLSHSGGTVLLGLAVDRSIGVDLELIDETRSLEKLAFRYFGTGEARAVSAASGKERFEIFYRYWTAKEAYLKATGDGISRLKDVRVCFDESCGCSIRDKAFPGEENWTVNRVSIAAGYEAAVAVEGEGCEFSVRTFF